MRKESGGSIPRATSVEWKTMRKENRGSMSRATSVNTADDEKGKLREYSTCYLCKNGRR